MRRSEKKRSGILGRFILWSILIVIVALLGAGYYGYNWIQDYLKSDAFRAQIASQLGRAANAEATVESLTWTGPDVHVTTASLNPKRDQAWKLISVDGIQATLDFSAARSGVWRVTRLSADSLRLDMRSAAEIPQSLPLEFEEPATSSVPQWLRRWIPSRAQVDEVQVQTFDLVPPTTTPGVSATGISVVGKPANDTGAWHLRGQGGKVSIPGIAEPFRITDMSARLDGKAIVFHDARAKWMGDSEVTARGDVPFEKSKSWSFNGSVLGLDLRHQLNNEWITRLSGMLEGDYEANATVLKTKIRVKNGIVQNMPVLNQVAAFTKIDRFRRIVLDAASADVERSGNIIKVSNLNLQSAGLIRVEGGFVVEADEITGKFENGNINGDLLVGVAPDTLNWLVSSVTDHVFTQRRSDAPGYVWTTVHISGPVGAPLENLSNRIVIAMGLMPLDLAGKGVGILTGVAGGLGNTATQGVIDTGKGVLKGSGDAAGEVIKTGVDIIKGVLPILGK